jgi:Phage tail tube protein
LPQPTWKTTIGAAKESTWGVPVSTPTVYFSTDKPSLVEKQDNIFDRGIRGIRAEAQSMSFGAGHSEVDIPNQPFYGDDSGNLLMALLGTDTIGGTARTGTIGAVSAGATSATYTAGTGGSSVTGDIFVIDLGLPTQEIVIPTSISANVWTVPASGPNSFKFAHTASAPAVTLFSHTLTLLNSGAPPSYTVMKYDALVATARQVAGVYFTELAVKFVNPGAMTADIKGTGKMGTNVTNTTATYSATPFFVPWQTTFTIASVANARVVDWEFTLKAPSTQIFGMNNTQSPTGAVAGRVSLTGKFTVVPDDYTEFNYYINNTQPVVLVVCDNGASRATFQMSKVAFIDPTTIDSSGDHQMLNASFEAISNSTDAGTGNAPLKATLLNGKSTAY